MNHSIYLTTECNFKCTYCYEDYKNALTLDEVKLKEIVDYIFQNDSSEKVMITFMGGEPLLKKDLIYKAIDYIHEMYGDRTVSYFMTTNCSLIDDKFIKLMKENAFSIRLSFDGTMESHDRNRLSRDKESKYSVILNNILKIKESGINYSVRMTVAENTIDKICENVVFFHEQGLDNINLILDINIDMQQKLIEELTSQMKRVKEYYLSEMDSGRAFAIDQFNGKFLNVLCDFGGHFHMCDGGVSNFKYMPSGDIYPCGFVTNNKECIVGNLKEKISPTKGKLVAYSYFDKTTQKCKDCDIIDFCHGMKCGYMNVATTGYVNVPPESVCKSEQIFYPLVVEIIAHISKRKDLYDTFLAPYFQWVEMDKLKLSKVGKLVMKG